MTGPTEPTATVRVIDGRLVLDDPDALGAAMAVEAHNRKVACQALFDDNAERVAHFVGRITARGDSPEHVLIVILDLDDSYGAQLADLLMPGQDWNLLRSHLAPGETPVARGLASRDGIQSMLDELNKSEGDALRTIRDVPAVVVMTAGTQRVFRAA